jgi:hypothetical protein
MITNFTYSNNLLSNLIQNNFNINYEPCNFTTNSDPNNPNKNRNIIFRETIKANEYNIYRKENKLYFYKNNIKVFKILINSSKIPGSLDFLNQKEFLEDILIRDKDIQLHRNTVCNDLFYPLLHFLGNSNEIKNLEFTPENYYNMAIRLNTNILNNLINNPPNNLINNLINNPPNNPLNDPPNDPPNDHLINQFFNFDQGNFDQGNIEQQLINQPNNNILAPVFNIGNNELIAFNNIYFNIVDPTTNPIHRKLNNPNFTPINIIQNQLTDLRNEFLFQGANRVNIPVARNNKSHELLMRKNIIDNNILNYQLLGLNNMNHNNQWTYNIFNLYFLVIKYAYNMNTELTNYLLQNKMTCLNNFRGLYTKSRLYFILNFEKIMNKIMFNNKYLNIKTKYYLNKKVVFINNKLKVKKHEASFQKHESSFRIYYNYYKTKLFISSINYIPLPLILNKSNILLNNRPIYKQIVLTTSLLPRELYIKVYKMHYFSNTIIYKIFNNTIYNSFKNEYINYNYNYLKTLTLYF